MKKICMVVQDKMVKGGIASVISGYYGSKLEKDYRMIYVESYKDGSKFTKLIKGICSYFHFIKVLLVDHPDIIHIHSSFGASFYRKIPFIYMASWTQKPIINHIHGADFSAFYLDATERKRNFIKKIYNKCTFLIALSEEWKENLSQIVSDKKIKVIENYSIMHNDALQERLVRNCNYTVLFLGELGKRKGCYDIPAVVEQVSVVFPEVKFILAGVGTREDEQAIKQLIKEKDVEKNVDFPGWVRGEQKDKLLREADIFFLPSYNEGMPMSILDAMGYGLPVVSTNVGGIPKIVHEGENGFCCPPSQIKSMSDAIVRILENDIDRKQMSQESIKIVQERYSLDIHIDHLEKIYISLLGE